MYELFWKWLHWGVLVLLYGLGTLSMYGMLQVLLHRKRRWNTLRLRDLTGYRIAATLPPSVVRLLSGAGGKQLEEKRELLAASGLRISVLWYELIRKSSIAACAALLAFGIVLYRLSAGLTSVQPVYFITAALIGGVVLYSDRVLLGSMARARAGRIVKEIYAVSNQLLYYSDSRMNLHAKLARCLSFTRTIRGDMQRLLNAWYQDPEQAILDFKLRLASDDGYSFAETLNTLRLNESEDYYGLLRQRIQDYKEKIELAQESRKETTSYALFVLAGLPILYTFRVFMYPWIIEGQRLFESLK
ncbi:hypothetical protein WBG83_14810 [Paenibacillus sp. y28]